jgi:hypothetical protein
VGKNFGIRAFGCDIAVISDCEQALAALQRYLLPGLPRIEVRTTGANITLRVVRDGGGYRIFCDGTNVSAGDFRMLVTEGVRLLDEAVVNRLSNLTAVHAGVVEFAGRALLLPGGTHAGKSALVAELLRRGAIYFSDEYALIDSSGKAHPYPRPLLLRNGGSEQVPLLPEDCGAPVGKAPIPVGWILVLEYEVAAKWRLNGITQSEGLLILLRNTPHALDDSPRIVPALKRAVAGSQCYTGQRNDSAEAAENILRLVAE